MIIFEWFKSRVICYLSQQLVTEWVQSAVSEKSEGQVRAVMELQGNKESQSIYLTLSSAALFVASFAATSIHVKQSKVWFPNNRIKVCCEVEVCYGSGTGQVKGTSSETTMQIPRHFVWQATTLLCIYAKPGKTLCTQPCCQSRVMLERWHPMGDPCLRARLLGQTSRWTLTDAHKTDRVTTCGTRDISEVKRGWTLRLFLIVQKPDRTRMIWFLEPFSSRWGEKYLISTLKFTQQPVYSAATKKLEIKHGKPH